MAATGLDGGRDARVRPGFRRGLTRRIARSRSLAPILRGQGPSDPGHHGTVVAARALPVIRPGHHAGAARAVDMRAEQAAVARKLRDYVLPRDDRAARLARVADDARPRQLRPPVARDGRIAVEGEVAGGIGPHALALGGCPTLRAARSPRAAARRGCWSRPGPSGILAAIAAW